MAHDRIRASIANRPPLDNPLLDIDGLPRFGAIRAEHVEPAVGAMIARNRRELASLLADTSPRSFENSILPIEEMADRLHRVWGPVRHLHGVMNAPALRDAYNACLPIITRYETELAHDTAVYRLYREIADQVDPARGDGAGRLLAHALRDFHLAGVDLPEDRKARFKIIMEELAQLGARFEQNLLDAMAAWSHHASDVSEVDGLPGTLLEEAAAAADEQGLTGWLFRLDQPTYVAVITHARDRELRERFYRAWVTRASDQADYAPESDNTEIMERMLALRHEAAGLVGFANYAEYSLAPKMARSVEEVRGFLEELARRARRAAAQELAELAELAGDDLEAWDVAFWSERLRHRKYALSDEQLRPYFPLPRVLSGLFKVIENLYGIGVEPVDGIETWDPSVRYYRLRAPDGQAVGSFYVDLHARSGKRSGAWMDEVQSRRRHAQGLQLPVAHLVCNFSRPTRDTPSLLTHDEVVTLFHEMGHVLHHVLTRVDYPSISGINGVPWDAVELPSQFMETFAWETEVVPLISGHYQTGEPLPESWLGALRASRNFQAAMQMVRQLEFALFDLRIHAEYDPQQGGRVTEILSEVRREIAVIRHPAYNRFQHGFSHIFGGGYAAGYYSYKWAEVLAADAYAAFEEHGIFDRALAASFRENILAVGGSRDIGDAYVAFRGRPAHVDYLLAQCGILTGTPGDQASPAA